jgi:hypothetical protein
VLFPLCVDASRTGHAFRADANTIVRRGSPLSHLLEKTAYFPRHALEPNEPRLESLARRSQTQQT